MNQKTAEWLQKLILLGIGLVIGNTRNIFGLPYDSTARQVLDALSMQYQQAAPAALLALIALYIGLETETSDLHIENVTFTESECSDAEA